MASVKQRVVKSPSSIPALCLFAVSYSGGWVAGQLEHIPIHRTVLICGSVAWLIALAFAFAWLESRVRTALAARETQGSAGSTIGSVEMVIVQPTDRHMN